MNNGIQWPYLCTSSTLVVGYRNASSFSHKTYRIETELYHQLFETDNSTHVSSVRTLKQHIVSADSAASKQCLAEVQLTFIERLIALPAPQDGLYISFGHFKLHSSKIMGLVM